MSRKIEVVAGKGPCVDGKACGERREPTIQDMAAHILDDYMSTRVMAAEVRRRRRAHGRHDVYG